MRPHTAARKSWSNRIAMAVAIGFVVLVGHTFVQIYGDRRTRERNEALLAAAKPYQAEVEKALQARAPMPKPARAMSARADGTIVIEVSDDKLPGARISLRPVTNAKGEPMWTCSAERIHPGLLPAWCRP